MMSMHNIEDLHNFVCDPRQESRSIEVHAEASKVFHGEPSYKKWALTGAGNVSVTVSPHHGVERKLQARRR